MNMEESMNIFIIILIIFGGALGIITSAGIIALMIGTIAFKVYRKVRYDISFFD